MSLIKMSTEKVGRQSLWDNLTGSYKPMAKLQTHIFLCNFLPQEEEVHSTADSAFEISTYQFDIIRS